MAGKPTSIISRDDAKMARTVVQHLAVSNLREDSMLKKPSRNQFALAAALACAGCAAQTSKSDTYDSAASFKSIDTDGNGQLSQQEIQTRLDSNHDNEISPEEWNQFVLDVQRQGFGW
jgi:hypothetical protein